MPEVSKLNRKPFDNNTCIMTYASYIYRHLWYSVKSLTQPLYSENTTQSWTWSEHGQKNSKTLIDMNLSWHDMNHCIQDELIGNSLLVLNWNCLFWCLTPEIWLETSMLFIHYEFVIHLPFNICSDTRALSRVLINTIVFIALIRQVRPADDFHLAQSMPAADSFEK